MRLLFCTLIAVASLISAMALRAPGQLLLSPPNVIRGTFAYGGASFKLEGTFEPAIPHQIVVNAVLSSSRENKLSYPYHFSGNLGSRGVSIQLIGPAGTSAAAQIQAGPVSIPNMDIRGSAAIVESD